MPDLSDLERQKKRIEDLAALTRRTTGELRSPEGKRLSWGSIIRSPQDMQEAINVRFSSRVAGEEGGLRKAYKDAFGTPLDIGHAAMARVLSYPAALNARAKESRSHVWFVWGKAGAGKSKSFELTGQALLDLHTYAHMGLAKKQPREKLQKDISQMAEHLFKPYSKTAGMDIDWNKWADDFIKGVETYGKSPDAAQLSKMTEASTTNVLHGLLAVQQVGVVVAGKNALSRRVGPTSPVPVFDDLFATAPSDDKGTYVQHFNQYGSTGTPVASATYTNNLDDPTVTKFIGDTLRGGDFEGVVNRTGIQMKVATYSPELLDESLNTYTGLTNERINAALLEDLHAASTDKKKREYLAQLANISPDQKAGEVLRTNLSTIQNLVKELGPDEFKQALDNYNKVIDEHGARAQIAYRQAKGNKEGVALLNDLITQAFVEKFGEAGIEKASQLFNAFDNIKSSLGYDYKLTDTRSTAETGMKDVLNTILKEGKLDIDKIDVERKEKPKTSQLVSKVKKDLAKWVDAFKDVDFTSLAESINFDAAAKENVQAGYYELGLIESLNNSHICTITKKSGKLPENSIAVGKHPEGEDLLIVDGDKIKTSRPVKQFLEMVDSYRKYMKDPEVADRHIRDFVMSNYGPGIASHVLLSLADAYHGSTRTIRGLMDGMKDLTKLGPAKDTYTKDEFDAILNTLAGIAQHKDARNLVTPEDFMKSSKDMLSKLVDVKSGAVNEDHAEVLQGMELFVDGLSKYIDENKMIGVEKKLREMGLDRDAVSKAMAIAGATNNIAKQTFTPHEDDLSKEFQDALEQYRKDKICPDQDGALKYVADTMPQTSKISPFSASLSSARALRYLGVE